MSPASAAVPQGLRAVVEDHFAPAQPHHGLETAQAAIDPTKIRTYVTLVQGGIAAAKAEWFVTNQAYEYRPVVIDVATGTPKTRRGKVYTSLDRGTILFVAGVEFSGNTIYVKLLSADIHRSISESHPSRVGVLLGFKFPAAQLTDGHVDAVIAEMMKWIHPFRNYESAAAFAAHGRS